jgi:hypothetical protein
MRKTIRQIAMILSLFMGISACASQRPVLSPNAQLMRAGAEGAERDIDDCVALAEVAMKQRREGSSVVTDTAASSVVGAAAGGAGGAIFGNAAQGAAAGAVGGTVASLMNALLGWMFRPKPPEPSNQQFVDRCLREKGYEPAGWK